MYQVQLISFNQNFTIELWHILFLFQLVHGLSCYYCPHYDDKCSESNPGDTVVCQMDDPTQDHYGDTCMVDHYVRTGNLTNSEAFLRGKKISQWNVILIVIISFVSWQSPSNWHVVERMQTIEGKWTTWLWRTHHRTHRIWHRCWWMYLQNRLV